MQRAHLNELVGGERLFPFGRLGLSGDRVVDLGFAQCAAIAVADIAQGVDFSSNGELGGT